MLQTKGLSFSCVCGGGQGRDTGGSPLDLGLGFEGLEKFPVLFSPEVGLVLWDILEQEWGAFSCQGHVGI